MLRTLKSAACGQYNNPDLCSHLTTDSDVVYLATAQTTKFPSYNISKDTHTVFTSILRSRGNFKKAKWTSLV